MKRMYLLLAVAVTLVALLVPACAGPGPTPGRTTITLDFATFWSLTDFQVVYGEQKWMDTLSSRVYAETTNYTLAWTKQTLPSPATLWTGVKAGTYDVVTTGPGYVGGIMPLWEGPEYPANLPGRTNALVMSMALKGLYDNFAPLQTEFNNPLFNIVPMYFWSTGPGYFLMVAGHNVSVLSDFVGPPQQRIRAANPASNLTITCLGAYGVKVAMSQALEQFQAGLIDGILCPTDTPKGFGLGAYVRMGTYAPFSYQFVFMNIMNKDTWNSLPAAVQAIFTSTNAKWTEYNGKLRSWGEEDGKQFCIHTIPGFSIYDLKTANPSEYATWVTNTSGLITTWIGANTTRAALWGNFTYYDNYYATTPPWSTWTFSYNWSNPDASRPPVPTFP